MGSRVRLHTNNIFKPADLRQLHTGRSTEDYLLEKLEVYREFDVRPFIGGQFLEYVFASPGFSGVWPYCEEARRLGFEAIEVSDNCVPLNDAERIRLIATAIDCGLGVHGEVGSKSVHTTAAVDSSARPGGQGSGRWGSSTRPEAVLPSDAGLETVTDGITAVGDRGPLRLLRCLVFPAVIRTRTRSHANPRSSRNTTANLAQVSGSSS